MSKFDFDIIVIGAGPAGMAVSIMASEMGLNVCVVEKNKLGGECMNVGCIPSKALLRIAKVRNTFNKLDKYEMEGDSIPVIKNIFPKIQKDLKYISDTKTVNLFSKATVKMGRPARFIGSNTVAVGTEQITAKRFFICTGTTPAIPPIPGLRETDILTNDNMFDQVDIPATLAIIGGGAIGTEMAQAFSRLGSKVTLVHMDEHLIPAGEKEAGDLLISIFESEGITVFNKTGIEKVDTIDGKKIVYLSNGEKIIADKLLVAAGRSQNFDNLNLDIVKVKTSKKGIIINGQLQTNRKHIYAVGDCNGNFLLSHAAMHQGMCALMNIFLPWPIKRKFRNYVVPWTIFTEPQVSFVGKTELQLKKEKVNFQIIKVNYEDYGAAIAEGVDIGYVKALVSPMGKIYGVSIVGEGSGEMINEWALAIQKNIKLIDIMFLQHSFPTMSFLNKRVSEVWMMNKMKNSSLKSMIKAFFYFRTFLK